MLKISFWIGTLLFILGVAAFVLTGSQSITALIPTLFGLLIIIFTLLALQEQRRKIAMHIAQGLALIGFLGSISGLVKVVMFAIGSGMLERPSAAIAQSIMALLCLTYLIFGIRSFIKARNKS